MQRQTSGFGISDVLLNRDQDAFCESVSPLKYQLRLLSVMRRGRYWFREGTTGPKNHERLRQGCPQLRFSSSCRHVRHTQLAIYSDLRQSCFCFNRQVYAAQGQLYSSCVVCNALMQVHVAFCCNARNRSEQANPICTQCAESVALYTECVVMSYCKTISAIGTGQEGALL